MIVATACQQLFNFMKRHGKNLAVLELGVIILVCFPWLHCFCVGILGGGIMLKRRRVDLCLSWFMLVVYRSFTFLDLRPLPAVATADDLFAVLAVGLTEASATVWGRVGLSAVVGCLLSAVWRLVHWVFLYDSDADTADADDNVYFGDVNVLFILLWELLVGSPFANAIHPAVNLSLAFSAAAIKSANRSAEEAAAAAAAAGIRHRQPPSVQRRRHIESTSSGWHRLRVATFDAVIMMTSVVIVFWMMTSYGWHAWTYTVAFPFVFNAVEATSNLVSLFHHASPSFSTYAGRGTTTGEDPPSLRQTVSAWRKFADVFAVSVYIGSVVAVAVSEEYERPFVDRKSVV